MEYQRETSNQLISFIATKLQKEAGARGSIHLIFGEDNIHRFMKTIQPEDLLTGLNSLTDALCKYLPNFMVADFLNYLANKIKNTEDNEEDIKLKVIGAAALIQRIVKEEEEDDV